MNLKKSFKSHSLLVRIISVFIVSALLACNLTACDKKDNKGERKPQAIRLLMKRSAMIFTILTAAIPEEQ